MHLKVIACDLDGTLPQSGVVASVIWSVLRWARRARLTLLLATDRRLETFSVEGPFAVVGEGLASLPLGLAYLCLGTTSEVDTPASGLVASRRARRVVPHVRHRHKYLRAPLPEAKCFYFHLNGRQRGPRTASRLWEFREALHALPVATLDYHLRRGAFERWASAVLHDAELARRLRKIARRPTRAKPCAWSSIPP
jgi:hypothetical protein